MLTQSFTGVFSAVLIVLVGILAGPAASESCVARDFLEEPLPVKSVHPLWLEAIGFAYPKVQILEAQEPQIAHDGVVIAADAPTARPTLEIITTPTVGDQFATVYPLSRTLDLRLTPFHDPGRARNERFFGLLYGSTPRAVEQDLKTVAAGPARFRVTQRHGVACQLAVAIGNLDLNSAEIVPFFSEVGGGYNWRRIAGTDRLSAHSYGIAIDLNPALGGYWRWTGATEGDVGPYRNKLPWELVMSMERRGFIWGGKWHHFDGMHFEYRPELILYSRLIQGARQ